LSKFVSKVYVVQRATRDGDLYGPPVAVKLTFEAAHALAKKYAPARVTYVLADKSGVPNGPDAAQLIAQG
jgi:hypothetical protein